MMYSETTENKKFGREECVKSVFLFLFNYLVFLGLIAFFIFFNTLEFAGGESGADFGTYFSENLSELGYLAASLLVLFVVIYVYSRTGTSLPR